MSAALRHVAIVGAGLVGGSVARAARAAGVARVTLTDADPEVRARAVALDLADEVPATVAATVAGAQLVVVAVPSPAVADVVLAAAAAAPEDAILTDAASLKVHVMLEIEQKVQGSIAQVDLETGKKKGNIRAMSVLARFVGGHPMAGSERSGPDAADAALFRGATWVLTPTAATSETALRTLTGFLSSLGARVLALTPERHDELVAVVSHLPQVVASTLADVAADAAQAAGAAVLAVAGGGFRDTTRIAASDPALWVGILGGNRAAVLEAVDAYLVRLGEVRGALAAEDPAALEAWLSRASAARRQLVPKADAHARVDLVVQLDDRPGQLAVATTALGAAGINVEDLAMRHAAEGDRGALLLRVDASSAAVGVTALEAAGLQVRVAGSGTGTVRAAVEEA